MGHSSPGMYWVMGFSILNVLSALTSTSSRNGLSWQSVTNLIGRSEWVSNRPEGRNTFRCSTPMCSFSSGVLIRNSAGPTFIPSLMASSNGVLLRSGTIKAGMSRLVTLLIDAASSSPLLVWVAPLVSIRFGVAMLGPLLFLIMRSGSVVFSKFSSPCCLVRIYFAYSLCVDQLSLRLFSFLLYLATSET